MARKSAVKSRFEKKLYFAQFRDADTAEAAATAPPAIRLYFEELRFDFIKNESSMSAGQYDGKDDVIRMRLKLMSAQRKT